MLIDENMLAQLVELKFDDMLELIRTVGAAAALNPQITKSPNDKIRIALELHSVANHMLENCGSTVEFTISNPMWKNMIHYLTDSDGGEPKDVMRDIL